MAAGSSAYKSGVVTGHSGTRTPRRRLRRSSGRSTRQERDDGIDQFDKLG